MSFKSHNLYYCLITWNIKRLDECCKERGIIDSLRFSLIIIDIKHSIYKSIQFVWKNYLLFDRSTSTKLKTQSASMPYYKYLVLKKEFL